MRLDRTTGPTPLLEQGHLQPVSQDHDQTAFEYLQGWRLHQLPGQPAPALDHTHGEKVFPDVQRAPLSRAWLRPLGTLPSGICRLWRDPPAPSVPRDEQPRLPAWPPWGAPAPHGPSRDSAASPVAAGPALGAALPVALTTLLNPSLRKMLRTNRYD